MVRNHYLVHELARQHKVWASFCGLSGASEFEGEVPLRREGLPALFDPPFLWRARAAIKQHKLEAIVSSSLIAGLHGALLKGLTGLPFWMDEHNVEWHCSKRYGHRLWWLIFLLEGFILKCADHITCVSEEDKWRLIESFRLPATRITVAPNGVDYSTLSQTKAEPAERTRKRVLFFGVLDYPPNREAVQILGEQIAPLLSSEIEVLIAGKGGQDLKERYPGLRFLGFVDDIHQLIRDCDGVVVPILAGGGTRMKILESVACERPVVSTTCGAEGIKLEALGKSITIADDWAAMISWIESLPLGVSVPVSEQFLELYDWQKIWQNKAPL